MEDWIPPEREASFGVIVFRGKGKIREVLLVQTDHVGFPKGHAEDGEDGFSAAIREVKEETGIDVSIGDPSRTLVEEYEIRRMGHTTKKTVTYWVGKGDGAPVPQEGEVTRAFWSTIEDATAMLRHESARHLLNEAMSYT